jgi:hypothetical protein
MSKIDIAAKCALEWLQSSGAKTDSRLYSLCEHFAESHVLAASDVYTRAMEIKPQWLRLA